MVVKARQVVTNAELKRKNRTKTGWIRLLNNLENISKCDYWLGTICTIL